MRAYVGDLPCIGFFYRHRQSGQVVGTNGGGGVPPTIDFYTESRPGSPRQSASAPVDEFLAQYEFLPELTDFPDAWDPKLPYEFDLYYDIQFTSELVRLLTTCGPTKKDHLLRLCSTYGLNVSLRDLPQLARKYSPEKK